MSVQIPINLSFSDLEYIIEKMGQIDLEKTLHSIGFDISFTVENIECQHRNRRGDIVTGKLFQGVERTDATWLKSDYASDEVKIASRNDPSYNREIANLSRRV